MPDHAEPAIQFERVVGGDHVMSQDHVTASYQTAGSSPTLVIAPGSPEEVAAVIDLAAQSGMAIVPWGGGTLMGRGFAPVKYDMALSLSRMHEVVDFDVANLTVTAQAGLTVADLQSCLKEANQFLPLNPPLPAQATIGGSIAANASGPGRFRYGSARDLVLGMRVALANGQIIHVGGKTVKNVAGYDLSKLFIGSYGTLGVVTEVTLRLLPCPEVRQALCAVFEQTDAALNLSARILDSELLPASLTILNQPAARWLLDGGAAGCALVVSLDGSAETVERQVKQISALLESAGASSSVILDGPARDAMMDKARDFIPLGLSAPRLMAFTTHVPLAATGSFVSELEKTASQLGFVAGCLAAADTGTVSCLVDGVDAAHLAEFYGEAAALAARLGGHCVLDHAAPELRRQVAVWGQPRDEWQVMRIIKQQFDPGGLFNRGRFVGGI